MADDIERYLSEYWDLPAIYGDDRSGELMIAKTLAEMALSLQKDSRRRCIFKSLECFLRRFVGVNFSLRSIDVRDFGIFFRITTDPSSRHKDLYVGRVAKGNEFLESEHLSYYPMN